MSQIFKLDSYGNFVLPLYEAKQIEDENEVSFLFEINDVKVINSEQQFKSFYNTEPHFPAMILDQKDYSLAKEAVLAKDSIFEDESKHFIVHNAATLWNLFGDGIHHSDLIYTPYYLTKGQKITVESKYNVPKMDCIVSNVNILRDGALKWFWEIAIKKVDF